MIKKVIFIFIIFQFLLVISLNHQLGIAIALATCVFYIFRSKSNFFSLSFLFEDVKENAFTLLWLFSIVALTICKISYSSNDWGLLTVIVPLSLLFYFFLTFFSYAADHACKIFGEFFSRK
ncbi:hypothetical protein [Pseudoalteromonas sp.]|uniref:hypothetical protein n=1 Tax=Pseudoalteromonas sp. TaxID=53249 RepID=UPI003001F17F